MSSESENYFTHTICVTYVMSQTALSTLRNETCDIFDKPGCCVKWLFLENHLPTTYLLKARILFLIVSNYGGKMWLANCTIKIVASISFSPWYLAVVIAMEAFALCLYCHMCVCFFYLITEKESFDRQKNTPKY